MYIESLEKLINCFRSLPGVGYKTAQRYAYSILNMEQEKVKNFTDSITEAKEKIKFCKECGNFSETEVCETCQKKNTQIICVVKEPKAQTNVVDDWGLDFTEPSKPEIKPEKKEVKKEIIDESDDDDLLNMEF